MTPTPRTLVNRSNGSVQYHTCYLPLEDDGDFDLRLEYRRNVKKDSTFVVLLQLTGKEGEEDPENPERTILLNPAEAKALAYWMLEAVEPGEHDDPGDVQDHLADLDRVDEVLR